jgi:hypothetical protein
MVVLRVMAVTQAPVVTVAQQALVALAVPKVQLLLLVLVAHYMLVV